MSTPTNASAPLSTVYCSDEDIAARQPDDFAVLAPEHQCLARGVDGVFLSTDRWTIQSASADFVAAGLAVGNVLLLTQKNVFQGSGELVGVASVSQHSVGLKRIGLAAGLGLPPGPIAGATGVAFEVRTFAPQIENATFDLNREYSIDDSDPARAAASLYDPRDLRQACVLMVLCERYRDGDRAQGGDFKAKLESFRSALLGVKDRLQLRWALQNDSNILPPPSTRFSMRIGR